MRKRFIIQTATALMVAAMVLAGCKKDEDPVPVKVQSVSLNKTTLTLAEGSSETLTATVVPADAENKAVTWKSDKTDIATVDADGKVTAVSEGKATITVTTTQGSLVATCTVTVAKDASATIPVTGVKLNRTTEILKVGDMSLLSATIAPGDATNRNVSWKSSNPDIASVNQYGLVTAVSVGSAVITVTTVDGGYTAQDAVTVTEKVTTLTYTYSDGKMYMENEDGDPLVFTYTAAGEFPSGEHISVWEKLGGGGYQQIKIVLNSDMTFYMDAQFATDAAGENIVTEWQEGLMHGTYTYTGTQSEGGTITLTTKYIVY